MDKLNTGIWTSWTTAVGSLSIQILLVVKLVRNLLSEIEKPVTYLSIPDSNVLLFVVPLLLTSTQICIDNSEAGVSVLKLVGLINW